MSAKTELGWSVNDAEVIKSFQRMQADNEKLKQQLGDIQNKSKQAGDAWTAGLRSVSQEQQRLTEHQRAAEAMISQLSGRYRTLREVMLGTGEKAKSTSETWAAGLRTIGEQQRPILEGHSKWADGLKKLRAQMEETRTAGMGLGDLQPVIDSNIASLTGMVGGLFAIDKVLDLVVEGYRDWSDEIENVKTHQQGLAVTTAQTLSASGDLLRMPELMRRAGGVQGATKDQWFAAFGGISGAAPTLPSSQREALADETARLAFLQRDPGAFARAVGDLAEAQPERTPQQTTGLALTLQRLVGDKFGEVSSDRFQRTVAEMTASGMSADQAMGVLVAGRRADLDPRTLETLALGMASSQGPGRIRGPEDVLKNKFYATQPGMERLALLQQRPDIANAVLGQGYDTRIGLLTPQAISDVQSAIAGSAGEGERQLAAAGGIPSVAREPLVGEFKSTPARSYGQAAQSLQTQEDLDEIFKAAGYSWAYRTAHARGAAFTRFLTGGEEPNLLPESIHRLQVVRSEVAGRSASTDQQRQDNEALVTRIDRMISLMEQQLNAQLKEAAKAPTVIPPNVDKANNQ